MRRERIAVSWLIGASSFRDSLENNRLVANFVFHNKGDKSELVSSIVQFQATTDAGEQGDQVFFNRGVEGKSCSGDVPPYGRTPRNEVGLKAARWSVPSRCAGPTDRP